MNKFFVSPFIVFMVLLVACGATQPSSADSSVPDGNYKNTVEIEIGPNSIKPVEAGLKLANGKWEVRVLGGLAYRGTYSLKDNTMEFVGEPEIGEVACAEGQEVGVYTWAYDGKQLKLTPLQDPCFYRKLVLPQNAWFRE